MAKDSESRRSWIKNVAIIFLVILLLLTFFSNTILNYSLPEVSAQYTKYASIASSVKVTGTIKANESYNVVYEASQAEIENGAVQSRKVVSVFVREGDTVEKDTPILELQGGASDQLKAAQDEYNSLKREYDLALLNDARTELESNNTLTDAKKAIADAQSELAELKAEYNALLGGVDTTSIVEERIERLEEELEVLTEQITTVSGQISDIKGKISSAEGMIEEDIFSTLTVAEKLAVAEEDYAVIEASYKELTQKVDEYKRYLDAVKLSAEDIAEANTLTTQLRSLQDQLKTLEKNYDRDYEDYQEQRSAYIEQIVDILNSQRESEEAEDEAAAESGEAESGGIEARVVSDNSNIIDSQLEAIHEQIDQLDKSYERSSEDALDQIEDLRSDIADIEEKLAIIGMPEVDDVVDYAASYDLAEAQKNYDNASAELAEITDKYNTAKANVESLRKQSAAEDNITEYEALLATYEAELESLETQQKQKNKELTAANKELLGAATPKDPETVAEQIKSVQDNIDSLTRQLAVTEASLTQSETATKYEREDQLAKLNELSAKIESYQTAPETTSVTAPIAGRIVSINYVPGDTVTSGNTVASIEIADRGYVCEITMSSDEARKIQVGAPCTLSNSWWYSSDIEASVTQIRPDPSSQGKNRIVIIEVKGDVYEGQSVTFSIGDKNQSYENVLPNSAIREDNDGKFVLVVEAKDSPLGTRYTARRVDIEIVASDDTQSAVSGLYGSEFVVTNSNIPITDGQRVRLADNN